MEESSKVMQEQRMNLFVTLWAKRKILIIVTSAGLVVSTVVAFLMTPLYRSTAIVFPAATSTVSFSEQRNAKASSMDFGEEEQAEQLIQILQSSKVRDKVVEKFDLMKHYDIDESDANKHYKLVKEYNSHILFVRTRYGSIQIDVLDKDAQLAADMANEIVDLIDTVKNEMVMERTVPAFEINKRKKEQLERDKEAVLDQLDSLASLGVVPLEGRANLFQAYVEAKNPADKADFKRRIDINLEFGAVFDGLEYVRNEKIMKLADFALSYEQAESDANTQFNHKFIVERAVKADKKDKPKRLIIMLLATFGTFVFMVFALLIQDKIREIRKLA
ncbi:Wzz/FepE/Etk N-terminal domain-containing protein [uncultured Fluviicola sp.]|uniref:Wzz/FepE/Etk N-terminal domain-containing protein n=1 Tax=uncultured Fluviicola sp. TaxID=463303 RepID=UPI0025DDCD1E|nr:Wzz/FepE/Etk N-terminal domain-containing protein [uncultured Fluviicola sp.]